MCKIHKELVPIIAPSILSADFNNLGRSVVEIYSKGANWIHIDIMDGHFVPNISIGLPVIKSLRSLFDNDSRFFFDCHMMVSNPEQWVESVSKFGGSQYTFHYETTENHLELIKLINSKNMKAAMAIKPDTDVEVLYPFIEYLDMVLIMTVEPGFGGQKFMNNMMHKIEKLRSDFPNLDIQVDGGLDVNTVKIASKSGANVIVAGTSVFGSKDKEKTIGQLKNSIQSEIDNRKSQSKL
ncbi:hypothetical protein BVG19_g5323 [[Candida] boidinii]|nr:hypothetical protein BVG19_g5323 [[Candida] boidinii]OWB51329.1 hypothetical protein B5S27_g2889 [[Candida] boidinii]